MSKFYGQFDHPVDKFIFDRYFCDKNIKGFFVECGAFDGETECSCKFFEESMGWQGINLEPSPTIFEKLTANRPHVRNIQVALSDHDGVGLFTKAIHPQFGEQCTNGSLAHLPEHKDWLMQINCEFAEVEVPLITWRSFIAREHISAVDLLVLDVEGHELQCIEGMTNCNVLPDIFCVEIGHLDFYTVKDAICALGYTYDISSYVNAFFIKEDRLPLFALRATQAVSERILDKTMLAPSDSGAPKKVDLQGILSLCKKFASAIMWKLRSILAYPFK